MINPRRRTKPERTGLNAPLGDLEQAVMRCIWGSKGTGVSGGDVQEQIGRNHPTALTTVLTTLDRLREKEIVHRQRDGKAYRYWSNVSEEELQQRIVGGVLDRLIAQFPRAVAAYFAQQGAEADQGTTLTELALHIEALKLEEVKSEGMETEGAKTATAIGDAHD